MKHTKRHGDYRDHEFGTHYHQCGALPPDDSAHYRGFVTDRGCGAIWSHRYADIADNAKAHTCPSCGKAASWAVTWAVTKAAMIRANPQPEFRERLKPSMGMKGDAATKPELPDMLKAIGALMVNVKEHTACATK
jgi:hypothetical protein